MGTATGQTAVDLLRPFSGVYLALAASNKEFAKYRAAQCEFSASLSGGGAGNAHEMGRLACVAALNGARVEQLRNAVSELPSK
ncbi:lysozyme inhibitor LprI family protein [Burkholderia anthina]|uniref:lysozyme inhibitor LprI family protein n=1 Tax=Burkholderia anthina TaxID=179879 RepID=UPI001E2A835F|nr:lysozyme inhibitor LprI family protein [Burkholderia anthina]